MAQAVNLDGAALNLSSLRNHGRQRLVEALDTVSGKKSLVLDPKLSGPLALVAQISLLKEHGVENLYHATAEPIQSECPAIVYVLQPRLQLLPHIAAQIRADAQSRVERTYHAFFVPRCTLPCRRAMETAEMGRVVVGEYPLQFFPFEDDAVSLELDSAFKDLHFDHVRTSTLDAARALATLQTVFGVPPLLKGKGEAAQVVADALVKIMRAQKATVPALPHSAISMMVLLDRKVDLVSPMCTQLTYEGLLDEILGIHNGAVEVDPSVIASSSSSSQQQPSAAAPAPTPSSSPSGPSPVKKVKVPLNSSDKLFKELRDVNFGVAAEALRAKAVRMKADYTSIKTSSAAGVSSAPAAAAAARAAEKENKEGQSVSELKDFVKKLNALPELTRHTSLAQHIAQFTNKPSFGARLATEQGILEGRSFDSACEYVEDMIGRQEPVTRVLRMLVLLSVTNSGIPKPKFDALRREIVQSYGIRYMLPLASLEQAGLVKKQEVRTTHWQTLRRALRLIVEDDDDANPKDIGFMYSGYAPISIRLVQSAVEGGWRSMAEALNLLPGPTLEWRQSVDGCDITEHPEPLRRKASGEESKRKVVLVVFLGGVTFSELAALRFLSSKEGSSTEYVVVTTKLVSGSSMLTNILDA